MRDENLCPVCNGKMVSRLNKAKQSRFWGCAKYPECKGTRDANGQSPLERNAARDESEAEDPFAPHHFGRWDR